MLSVTMHSLTGFPLEEDKKVLCQLLGKLHLPEKVDEDKLRTLKLLMHNLRSVGSMQILMINVTDQDVP